MLYSRGDISKILHEYNAITGFALVGANMRLEREYYNNLENNSLS